jgi:hypothetical protein
MSRRATREAKTDLVRVTVRMPRAEAARLRDIAAGMRRAPPPSVFQLGDGIDDETWALFEAAIARPTEPHPRDIERGEELLRDFMSLDLDELAAATDRLKK